MLTTLLDHNHHLVREPVESVSQTFDFAGTANTKADQSP